MSQEVWQSVVLMLNPVVPHICHALWQGLTGRDDLLAQRWPQADAAALVRDSIALVVQVNGKLRGNIEVPAGAGQDEIVAVALADENVRKFTDGQAIKKKIVVPGKLVNFVV